MTMTYFPLTIKIRHERHVRVASIFFCTNYIRPSLQLSKACKMGARQRQQNRLKRIHKQLKNLIEMKRIKEQLPQHWPSEPAARPLHHNVIKKIFPSVEKPQLILNDRPSKLYCRALCHRAVGCSQYRFCDFFPLVGWVGEWHVSFNGAWAGTATREKTEKSLIHTWFHV